MSETAAPFTVHLVDDDEAVLRGMTRLLRSLGYDVKAYQSALTFLKEHDPDIPGCLILDLAMPELDGLQLQAALAQSQVTRPIIFMSGTGDIPTSVRAMKAGAIDFLTKPASADQIVAAIERAAEADRRYRLGVAHSQAIEHLLEELTPREREVADLIAKGRLNKQIAFELSLSIRTVEVHRGRIMAKLGVRSVIELVRIFDTVAGAPDEKPAPGDSKT